MGFAKKLSALLLACTAALYAGADTAGGALTLTVQDAVDHAVEGNLSLRQSEIQLQSAKRASGTSWNSLIPRVTASAQANHSFLDPGITSVSVGGSASLSLTPSLYTSIKSASLSYAQQQITFENARRTVELNVRQLFYSLLYGQEYLALLKSTVDGSRRQYESDLAKYNRGTLPRMNVLSDQVSLQSAQLSYDNQKLQFDNSLAQFKQMLGIPQETEITLSGSLDDILSLKAITREDVDAVRQKSAAMENLETQRDLAKNALLATRFAAWGPTLSASYNINWSGNDSGGMGKDGKQAKGDFEWGPEPATHSISVGVSIPLDGFLPWSSGAQSVANQKDNLASLELSIENERTTEEINIRNYLNTIRSTQENMRLGQSNVNLAQQNYDLTADAYNHGTRSLLELQTARDNLNSAKVSVMANATTLITAILNLENTIGVPFGTLGH